MQSFLSFIPVKWFYPARWRGSFSSKSGLRFEIIGRLSMQWLKLSCILRLSTGQRSVVHCHIAIPLFIFHIETLEALHWILRIFGNLNGIQVSILRALAIQEFRGWFNCRDRMNTPRLLLMAFVIAEFLILVSHFISFFETSIFFGSSLFGIHFNIINFFLSVIIILIF